MAKKSKISFETMQGNPIPLGVTTLNGWVNFAVSVPNERECQLHLYSRTTGEKVATILLTEENRTGDVFAVMIRNIQLQDYTYLYQTKDKAFVDPYAGRVVGREQYGKRLTLVEKQRIRGGFLTSDYTWMENRTTPLPFSQLIIYKMNVRGFTMHSSSKVKEKGTFLGITEKMEYLKELGVNCIQLMPVYEFNEILEYGGMGGAYKLNYWGYSGDNLYFAPKSSYAVNPEDAVNELKGLVDTLHKNGMQILLEMNFRNGTNHGLIQDCLRYWSLEYHIDGFKLNQEAIPISLLAADPILSRTKLLSAGWNMNQIYEKDFEPKYINLAEYNDAYSKDVRKFLKADEEQVGAFASRIIRIPEKCGIVNYITNHDGFTMMDLYSYDQKHNEANGENNKDGAEYNYSWNCGEEGDTRRKRILDLRRKQIKNAFTALLFSQGTPLIVAGDEFGNSQQGNNNAYCQDNEISWLNWDLLSTNNDLFSFLKHLIQIRKDHPILHMEYPLKNMDYISCGFPDVSFHGTKAWYPDYSHYSRMLGVMLCGKYVKIDRKENDWIFYLIFNMHWEKHEFDLPRLPEGMMWQILIDTTEETTEKELRTASNQKQFEAAARSAVVLVGK